jgi:hypothetical protein
VALATRNFPLESDGCRISPQPSRRGLAAFDRPVVAVLPAAGRDRVANTTGYVRELPRQVPARFDQHVDSFRYVLAILPRDLRRYNFKSRLTSVVHERIGQDANTIGQSARLLCGREHGD